MRKEGALGKAALMAGKEPVKEPSRGTQMLTGSRGVRAAEGGRRVSPGKPAKIGPWDLGAHRDSGQGISFEVGGTEPAGPGQTRDWGVPE